MRGPTPEELAEIEEDLLATEDAEILQGELLSEDVICTEKHLMIFLANIACDLEATCDEVLENLSLTPEVMCVYGNLEGLRVQADELYRRAVALRIGELPKDA
jgi:hypothetical protein